ncbi:hypothetical protein PVAP13_7KG351370 [Panicum virgatum]|uniref:Uncharacterized protein n=1 Tax=Panicum virgatum TaxID=38727 RepID=A0A8T0QME3_PANVG|nr:hypothetical protein PVAP13_7KG351370 [Panicum virgatum]
MGLLGWWRIWVSPSAGGAARGGGAGPTIPSIPLPHVVQLRRQRLRPLHRPHQRGPDPGPARPDPAAGPRSGGCRGHIFSAAAASFHSGAATAALRGRGGGGPCLVVHDGTRSRRPTATRGSGTRRPRACRRRSRNCQCAATTTSTTTGTTTRVWACRRRRLERGRPTPCRRQPRAPPCRVVKTVDVDLYWVPPPDNSVVSRRPRRVRSRARPRRVCSRSAAGAGGPRR